MAVITLLAAGTAAAQGITGVALGPDGQPLADHTVILHRVGAGGGAMAGSDTTDASGAFTFVLDGDEQTVYFAALRYDGELYIGPAIEGGESMDDYVLEVGPGSAIGNVGSAGPGGGLPPAQPPRTASPQGGGGSSDAGALWLVAILAVVAAAAFVYTAPRYRQRRTREALIELAGIENRLAGASGERSEGELSESERDRLQARHDRLKGQLAPGG